VNADNFSSIEFHAPGQSLDWALRRLPRRTSLVRETAATLKEWISRGVLKEELPGELLLKHRLGVGRDTLRLALKRLAREGWVSAATRGCQRRVRPDRAVPRHPAAQDQLSVTVLSLHPIENRVTLFEMRDTQVRLAEQGRRLRFVSPRLARPGNAESQLAELVETYPSAAWVLHATNEAIQRWFAARDLPAFLHEAPFPGIDLPYVAPDWEGAAFHAGLHLVRNGHGKIGLLEHQQEQPCFMLQERGLERALNSANGRRRLVLFKNDGTPASVADRLEAVFRSKERPTAVVLTRPPQLLTCYSYLASRGLRVPADVSIVALAGDSWFAHLHPAVSHYERDSTLISRSIADRVIELVSTGRLSQKSLWLRLQYCPGATIGAAPR
jgi:DNA-binding LacI/PurR family transcriptional regulator